MKDETTPTPWVGSEALRSKVYAHSGPDINEIANGVRSGKMTISDYCEFLFLDEKKTLDCFCAYLRTRIW